MRPSSRHSNSSGNYGRDGRDRGSYRRGPSPRDHRGGSSYSRGSNNHQPPVLPTPGRPKNEWERALELGLNPMFLKRDSKVDPKLSQSLGIPDYYPTKMTNPEEKFSCYVEKREGYVEPLPPALTFGQQCLHRQYGSMLEYASQLSAQYLLFQKEHEPSQTKLAAASSKRTALLSFLKSNVRGYNPQQTKDWMDSILSGKRTLQEIVRADGIPQKPWKQNNDAKDTAPALKYPLLDSVAEHQPPLSRATWFIKINVLYSELDELHRDSGNKFGDWSYDTRRLQMRSKLWTKQLIDYISTIIRCVEEDYDPQSQGHVVTDSVGTDKGNKRSDPTKDSDNSKRRKLSPTSSVEVSSSSGKVAVEKYAEIRKKWLYVIRLAQWQFEAGMLDNNLYFDGWITLVKTMLVQKKTNSGNLPPLRLCDCRVVVQSIFHHLSQIYSSGEHTRLLIKALLQNVSLFCPGSMHPRLANPPASFRSPEHERLFTTFCELLRTSLLSAPEALVRIDEDMTEWPAFLFEQSSTLVGSNSPKVAQKFVQNCRNVKHDIIRRIGRLREYYSNTYLPPSRYSETEVIEVLDKFHSLDTDSEVNTIYSKIFYHPKDSDVHPVDSSGVFLLCEWAVTESRPTPFRVLTAIGLLEAHAKKTQLVAEVFKSAGTPPKKPTLKSKLLVLQEALQEFLQSFEPKVLDEIFAVLELMTLLIHRRLFSVPLWMRYLTATGILDPQKRDKLASVTPRTEDVWIECGPSRGFNEQDLLSMSVYDRCMLYLWQFPRGADENANALPIYRESQLKPRLLLNQWLALLQLSAEEVRASGSLAEAQQLVLDVFCLYGLNTADDDRVYAEVKHRALVGRLMTKLRQLSAHDKGCLTTWLMDIFFNRQKTSIQIFQIDTNLATLESVCQLLVRMLDILDLMSLLQLILWLLSNASTAVVRSVVVPVVQRYELAFSASRKITDLLQSFVDRFRSKPSQEADDSLRTIGKFFCEVYFSHKKKSCVCEWDKSVDLPQPLLIEIARGTRNKDAMDQSKEIDTLDATPPLVRIPAIGEKLSSEMENALNRAVHALKTPPETSEKAEPLFLRCSVVKSMDAAIDKAVKEIAPFCTRPNEHVYIFRWLLMAMMEEWIEAARKHKLYKRTSPLGIPSFIHRCIRLLRGLINSQKNPVEFRENFTNTLLVWLFKEVIPAFAGLDPGTAQSTQVKNPYASADDGKESFAANRRGELNIYQCGLRAVLQSLLIYGIVNLVQLIRLVFVPGLPQQRKSSKGTSPSLGSQLLSMTLMNDFLTDMSFQKNGTGVGSVVNYTDPAAMDYLRYLRLQLPLSIVYPLIHRLCKIAYQMDKQAVLRKRDDRSIVASIAFFGLTADPMLREIALHDTKRLSEHYIRPLYQESQWYAAVLMSQLCRPPHQAPEDKDGRVHLRQPEEILDDMTVWSVNRGGWLLLNLQLERQQFKQKKRAREANGSTRKPPLASPALNDPRPGSRPVSRPGSTNPPPLPPPSGTPPITSPPSVPLCNPSPPPPPPGEHSPPIPLPKTSPTPPLPPPSNDEPPSQQKPGAPPPLPIPQVENDMGIELDFGEAKDATESLAHIIIKRLIHGTRSAAATPLTVASRSPMPSPGPGTGNMVSPESMGSGEQSGILNMVVIGLKKYEDGDRQNYASRSYAVRKASPITKESYNTALATLYSSLVCRISRRALAAALVELQDILKKDAVVRRKLNTRPILLFLRGLLCHASAADYLPMFAHGLIKQFEWLLEDCRSCDATPEAFGDSTMVTRLLEKVALRLQLLAIITPYIKTSANDLADRIAKVLLQLLATTVVGVSGDEDIFTWILDTLQMIKARVMQEEHAELLGGLKMNDKLKRRVELIFPKMTHGTSPILLNCALDGENRRQSGKTNEPISTFLKIDPWMTLEQVPDVPSINSLLLDATVIPKKPRRFFG